MNLSPEHLSFWINAEKQIQRDSLKSTMKNPRGTRRCAIKAWQWANPDVQKETEDAGQAGM